MRVGPTNRLAFVAMRSLDSGDIVALDVVEVVESPAPLKRRKASVVADGFTTKAILPKSSQYSQSDITSLG